MPTAFQVRLRHEVAKSDFLQWQIAKIHAFCEFFSKIRAKIHKNAKTKHFPWILRKNSQKKRQNKKQKFIKFRAKNAQNSRNAKHKIAKTK